MNIPGALQDSAVRIFGPAGRAWLERLPGLLDRAVEKWGLSDVTLSSDMSINLICFATSPECGRVVLKIGFPHLEFFTEIRALDRYGGDHICRRWDSDPELGAMVLERVEPGHQLAVVPESSERIAIAAPLARALLHPAGPGDGYPRVSDQARRAFERLRRENRADQRMFAMVDAAEGFLGEFQSQQGVLLHGDLHHYNILQEGTDGWKAIDPKGVIGPVPMQSARFIINELDFLQQFCWEGGTAEMTAAFAGTLGVPGGDVAIWAFIDKMLTTCWKFEEHVEDDRADDIEQGVNSCSSMYRTFNRHDRIYVSPGTWTA